MQGLHNMYLLWLWSYQKNKTYFLVKHHQQTVKMEDIINLKTMLSTKHTQTHCKNLYIQKYVIPSDVHVQDYSNTLTSESKYYIQN